MSSSFSTTTYGKWILAGEHAVLRGHQALVFPIQSKRLTLRYEPTDTTLSGEFTGEHGSDLHLLFWSVLEHGAMLLNKSLNTFTGKFFLDCSIPIGVGMGASAALCVATARWFAAQKFLSLDNLQSFSTTLENLFHGKSSGLDVAGVATPHGILYQKGTYAAILQNWNPVWSLSSCGQIGITSHCIQQVESLWESSPEFAKSIDEDMQKSVELATTALATNHASSLQQLATAIELANTCFHRWGLVSEGLQHHMSSLKDLGALAVKPTGSGGGGFVLSLWPDEAIPLTNKTNFIAINPLKQDSTLL